MLFRNTDRRKHTCRVTGMDAGKLDMLHNSRHKSVCAVSNGIGFDFDGVFQKLINQDGPFWRDVRCSCDIKPQHLFIVNDFHSAAAKDIGGPYH